MRLHACKNKKVLILKNKAAGFLKDFSSNTPEAPQNAFVTIRGVIVAVFDQKLLDKDRALLVVEQQFIPRIKNHLNKYLELNGAALEEMDYTVYFDLTGDAPLHKEDIVIPQKKGRLILSENNRNAALAGDAGARRVSIVSEDEFILFRLQNNIPVQGIDFDEELLLNVSERDFVSYSKGCYLGQEIIARVHHRSKPPKKLVVQGNKFVFVENKEEK